MFQSELTSTQYKLIAMPNESATDHNELDVIVKNKDAISVSLELSKTHADWIKDNPSQVFSKSPLNVEQTYTFHLSNGDRIKATVSDIRGNFVRLKAGEISINSNVVNIYDTGSRAPEPETKATLRDAWINLTQVVYFHH